MHRLMATVRSLSVIIRAWLQMIILPIRSGTTHERALKKSLRQLFRALSRRKDKKLLDLTFSSITSSGYNRSGSRVDIGTSYERTGTRRKVDYLKSRPFFYKDVT